MSAQQAFFHSTSKSVGISLVTPLSLSLSGSYAKTRLFTQFCMVIWCFCTGFTLTCVVQKHYDERSLSHSKKTNPAKSPSLGVVFIHMLFVWQAAFFCATTHCTDFHKSCNECFGHVSTSCVTNRRRKGTSLRAWKPTNHPASQPASQLQQPEKQKQRVLCVIWMCSGVFCLAAGCLTNCSSWDRTSQTCLCACDRWLSLCPCRFVLRDVVE